MSTKLTAVAFPSNQFAQQIDKNVVAKMNKEEGRPFGVLLKNDIGFTMEINDTSIVKSQVGELKDSEGKLLPVGAKVFFEEDGSLLRASFPTPAEKKAEAPKAAVRTSGSYERPAASRSFDRQ